MKNLLRIGVIALTAVALFALPERLLAQNANDAGSSSNHVRETNEVAKIGKKPVAGPFHGKLLALDKIKRTIGVGKRTFQISSETRIKKAGKPATLEDGVVGEPVSGYVKPMPDGKWDAISVNFGPKLQESGTEPKKSKAVKETN